MRSNLISILKTQGQNPIILSIQNSVKDLKKNGYTNSEIKETINDTFKGLDSIIDFYIIKIGY